MTKNLGVKEKVSMEIDAFYKDTQNERTKLIIELSMAQLVEWYQSTEVTRSSYGTLRAILQDDIENFTYLGAIIKMIPIEKTKTIRLSLP